MELYYPRYRMRAVPPGAGRLTRPAPAAMQTNGLDAAKHPTQFVACSIQHLRCMHVRHAPSATCATRHGAPQRPGPDQARTRFMSVAVQLHYTTTPVPHRSTLIFTTQNYSKPKSPKLRTLNPEPTIGRSKCHFCPGVLSPQPQRSSGEAASSSSGSLHPATLCNRYGSLHDPHTRPSKQAKRVARVSVSTSCPPPEALRPARSGPRSHGCDPAARPGKLPRPAQHPRRPSARHPSQPRKESAASHTGRVY
jgi:hypothetical protein